MEPKIADLEIHQFRAIRDLKLEKLGRVNLITGRNNTGKSSVLEALRILASNASLDVIYDILRFREEEEVGDPEDGVGLLEPDTAFPLSSLFCGYPKLSDDLQPIVITSSGSQHTNRVSLSAGWALEEQKLDGTRTFIAQQTMSFGDSDALPAVIIDVNGHSRIVPFDNLRRSLSRRLRRPNLFDERQLPCIFVSPHAAEKTAALGPLWDKIALSDYEEDVVNALRIIHPEISAISMVGGEGPRRDRTAIVRAATGISRPVPLRSFGDGMNRLFGIVLSLVNAKDGLLLIDEFENGLHHTVQVDVWRTVFKLANRLDIQVVATSHSWDAVEAFQKAASEDPEEGVLIRLSRKNDDIIPTVFREDEVALIARDRIEVR